MFLRVSIRKFSQTAEEHVKQETNEIKCLPTVGRRNRIGNKPKLS